MLPCSFRVGEILAIAGKTFQIDHVIGKHIHLRGAEQGDIVTYEMDELLQLYAKGDLQFLDLLNKEQGSKAPLHSVKDRVLGDFPEKIQEKALRKFKYLRALCPKGAMLIPRAVLQETLKELSAEIETTLKAKPPSVETFYRWRKRWLRANFDVRALIDKFELRGLRPQLEYPQRLVQIINEGIDTVYLTEERKSKRELYEWIEQRIKLENRTRAPDEQLPKASMRLIHRFLDQHERYQILKARFGERIAKQSTRIFNLGPQCERPLERVEVDHTPLDLLVVHDKTGLILGRPWITVMIDKYTRMVIGMYISFRRPSAESVLRCLRHAILPKTYVKERFPDVVGDWPCYGLIEVLYCDNGLEFHAKALEAACASLGIHVVYCPPRSPHLKGAIERFLKTLNYNLIHMFPGTTFSKYEKRLDYDTDKKAVLTYSQLEEILHRWLIDIYSIDFHRGIHGAPYQRWQDAIQIHPPRLPPSPEHLKVYLGKVGQRKLDSNGIRIHGLTYTSPALEEWWNKAQKREKSQSQEVLVRFDPDDIETLYVLDPKTNTYIEAVCTIPGYATNLTIEQHNAIQEKARKDYNDLPYRDRLLATKAALQEFAKTILEGATARLKGIRKADKKVTKEEKAVFQEDAMNSLLPAHNGPSTQTMASHTSTDDFEFNDDDLIEFDVADRCSTFRASTEPIESFSFDAQRSVKSVFELPKDFLDLPPPFKDNLNSKGA